MADTTTRTYCRRAAYEYVRDELHKLQRANAQLRDEARELRIEVARLQQIERAYNELEALVLRQLDPDKSQHHPTSIYSEQSINEYEMWGPTGRPF